MQGRPIDRPPAGGGADRNHPRPGCRPHRERQCGHGERTATDPARSSGIAPPGCPAGSVGSASACRQLCQPHRGSDLDPRGSSGLEDDDAAGDCCSDQVDQSENDEPPGVCTERPNHSGMKHPGTPRNWPNVFRVCQNCHCFQDCLCRLRNEKDRSRQNCKRCSSEDDRTADTGGTGPKFIVLLRLAQLNRLTASEGSHV